MTGKGTHMKIHLQPAIPYDPSSFTIAKARILPNAETIKLTTYHKAIRFWTSYRIYQQLHTTWQKPRLENPNQHPTNNNNSPIIRKPIPNITAPQLTARPHSCCRGPIYRRERVEGSSNRKYVMKKTRRAME
jgi:hypothetical protein